MRALRPLVIALALLVILDLVLALPVARRSPRNLRISQISTQGLEEQADAMSVDDAVSIAVIGDSVVQGLLAKRNQTAPYYLDRVYQRSGRAIRAYNLGMSAAHGLELFAATDRAVRKGHADVVVLAFNYAFYGSSKTRARYPWLYDDPSWLGTYADDPAIGRAVEGAAKGSDATSQAEKVAGASWRLYRTRGYWAAALFDGPPVTAIHDAVNELRARVAGTYREPAKLKPDELKGQELRRMFDVPELSLQHEDARLFLESVELAHDSGARVIVVVTPLNRTGLRYQRALDEARFARNLAWMKSEVEKRGGEFYDLSASFPEELIADSVHPLPAGYEEMARLIAQRIEPAVRAAEIKSEAGR